MKTFVVGVREVWIHSCEVEAETAIAAKRLVYMHPELLHEAETDFEFDHTQDPEMWTSEEKPCIQKSNG